MLDTCTYNLNPKMHVLLAMHHGAPRDHTQRWTGVRRDGEDVRMVAMEKTSKRNHQITLQEM